MKFSFPIAQTDALTPDAVRSWIGKQCTVNDTVGVVEDVALSMVDQHLELPVVTVSVGDDTDVARSLAADNTGGLDIRLPPLPTMVLLTVTPTPKDES